MSRMSARSLLFFLRRTGLPPQLLVLLGVDMLTLFSVAVLASLLRGLCGETLSHPVYPLVLPLIMLAPVLGIVLGLYRSIALPPHRELKALFGMTSLLYALVLVVLFVTKNGDIFSRLVLVGAWAASVLLLPVMRSLCRYKLGRRTWWGCPLIIIGASQSARSVWHTVRQHPECGLKPVLLLDVPASAEDLRSPLDAALHRYPNAVGLVLLKMGDAGNTDLVRFANRFFRQLLIVPHSEADFYRLWVTPCDIGKVTALLLSQNLRDRRRLAIKRGLDLVLCLLAMPIILPLGLVLAAAIRLDNRGPVFYRQKRIGQYGKAFYIFKFRSMRVDADAVLAEYLAAKPALRKEWQRDQKLRNDPRVTRVGRFLRKTSLDELPQLINVLMGSMSLVGPRPILESQVVMHGPVFEQYCCVRPGITGLWQVSGRNNTSYAVRVSCDNYYISNWSVWLDIWILCRTVPVALTGDGAY